MSGHFRPRPPPLRDACTAPRRLALTRGRGAPPFFAIHYGRAMADAGGNAAAGDSDGERGGGGASKQKRTKW